MASEVSVLSAADRAALVEGFRPLESASPSLPERLIRYVIEGDDPDVQADLLRTQDAGRLLGLDFLYLGFRQIPGETRPAWDLVLDHSDQVPVEIMLRLARVLNHLAQFGEGEPPGEPVQNRARQEPRSPTITKDHLGEIPPVLLSECHADLLSVGGSAGGAGTREDDDERDP